MSDSGLSVFETQGLVAAVIEEAQLNAQNFTFASMMCMFALATVINCCVESYYPVSKDSSPREEWDSLEKMFNCTILPKHHCDGGHIETVHIFRCAVMPQRYLVDRRIPPSKNHFVALCQPINNIELEPGEHYFSPQLPQQPASTSTSSTDVKNQASTSSSTFFMDVKKPSTSTSSKNVKQQASTASTSSMIVNVDIHPAPLAARKQQDVVGVKRKQLCLDTLLPRKKINDRGQPSLQPTKEERSIPTTISTPESSVKKARSFHPKDVHFYVGKASTLSDAEKNDLLCNVWKPDESYRFPVDPNSQRRFQHSWLTRFSWLAYSAVDNGGFCLNCLLFGTEGVHNASKLQRLVSSPLLPSTSSSKKLTDHAMKSKVHQIAAANSSDFRRMMEGKQAPIDIQLNNARREMIEKNRMKLRPIVSCIITCARQNVALRGHRDDAHHYIEDDALNPGNFIMFLKYGAYCGNIMDLLFKDCPSNKTYRSKTIQNDILAICGEMVKEVIVEEVKKAKFFTVLADEATDCSNIEQMALVLRFLDSSQKIREDFLGFIACEDGLTGQALSQEITNFVGDQGLSMDDCRGQGYDGAGNMAGKLSGIAARIQGTHEKAIYVHCNSHILNLCVASCCSIPFVRDMMDNVSSISNFFNDSPKRTQILTGVIKEVYPKERQIKLLNVCRTRWVARIDGLKIFRSCYLAILKALKEIKKNSKEPSVRQRIDGMVVAMKKFKFLVSLILVERCLKCTKPLTLQLQSASLDAGKAREKVSLLFLTINELRSDIDNTHDTFYQMAIDLAKEVNVEPKKKRVPAVQVHGVNVPSVPFLSTGKEQ